jgi:hypothetical protein
MTDSRVFDCPSCGAKLTTDGTQAQVTCEYCGSAVTVPEALRVNLATAQAPVQAPVGKEQLAEAFIKLAGAAEAIEAEHAAEKQAHSQPTSPPVHQARRGGCGCLLLLLVLAALAIVASGLIPGVTLPPPVREILGIIGPTSTPAVVNRPLQGTLPREVRYANLDFKVNAATVTNEEPDSSAQAPQYRADQAYAVLDLLITNPLTTKTIYLDSDVVRLELAGGKGYPESSGWSGGVERQSSGDARLVFNVPYAATLKGAKLILQGAGKQPATLPLDGPAPDAQYPIRLASGERATVGTTNYTVLSATLDLDADGKRADAGKRFLLLKTRVENTSDFRGGMTLGGDNFRLVVDGVPLAPDVSPSMVIDAKSAIDGDVVFSVPEAVTEADLQVGEVGREQPVAIPVSLKGGK